jgi:hypothetical protein
LETWLPLIYPYAVEGEVLHSASPHQPLQPISIDHYITTLETLSSTGGDLVVLESRFASPQSQYKEVGWSCGELVAYHIASIELLWYINNIQTSSMQVRVVWISEHRAI